MAGSKEGVLRLGGQGSAVLLVISLAAVVCLLMIGCGQDTCVCPEKQGVVMTYLFMEAWGDCPAGCTGARYWYFQCARGGCEFIGSWHPGVEPEPPEWWERALASRTSFKYGQEFEGYPWDMCWDVTATPKKDREAEEAALWLSGSLVAPDTLYSMILEDLAMIRSDYGERFPQVESLSFWPRWVQSMLSVGLTREGEERFRAGDYHDLDSLNSWLGVVGVEYKDYGGVGGFLRLSFAGRLNPMRLAEIYEGVGSVSVAQAYSYMGDFPNVYPWLETKSE